MAAGLKRTRVECKSVHIKARIGRSDYTRATELVRNIAVKEFSRELAEEVDTMRLEAKRRDVASLVLDVELRARTDDTSGSDRGVSDLAITMPVLHVGVNNRRLRPKGAVAQRRRRVGNHLETKLNHLNRPLKLNKMDTIRALVAVLRLVAMDTDQRERNTVNKDVVDFREEEQVVDVEIERADLRRGERGSRKLELSARVDARPVKVASGREAERNETLTVRDGDRRERKAKIGRAHV